MRRVAGLAVCSVVAIAGATVASAAPVSSGVLASPAGEAVFEYTGDAQDFRVPADVCALTIEAWGAGGGGASARAEGGGSYPSPAEVDRRWIANGGYAKATIIVTPGETLEVNVGGVGADGELPDHGGGTSVQTSSGAPGGWPDGGDGALAVSQQLAPDVRGFSVLGASALAVAASGGGGGSSDVRRGGTALANRVVVAGGGAGAGAGAFGLGLGVTEYLYPGAAELPTADSGAGSTVPIGGDGGGETGGNGGVDTIEDSIGVAFPAALNGFAEALGGSQTAGGTAGTGGGDGALGAGGDGAASTAGDAAWDFPEVGSAAFDIAYAEAAAAAAAGGGGGGGYHGGGGGGAQTATDYVEPDFVPIEVDAEAEPDLGVAAAASAGGGGGGSGYGPAGTVLESGVNEGDGMVVLSWTADPGCGDVSPAEAVVAPIRFTG